MTSGPQQVCVCPLCGSTALRYADGITVCGACSLVANDAQFARLSDAAALLRAVERLETLAPHGSGRTIECYAAHAAVLDWQASRMAVDAAVVCEVDGAATLAAALIALAGEVGA